LHKCSKYFTFCCGHS